MGSLRYLALLRHLAILRHLTALRPVWTSLRAILPNRARFRTWTIWLHALHFYGATGIAAFGWVICVALGWSAEPWIPLWWFAALFIYNLDRLRSDPADQWNTPKRLATSRSLRWVGAFLTLASVAMLVGLPIQRHDWITLALVLLGGAICLGYSIPIFGRRLKEVPALKTFFAPTVVVLAVFFLPLLHEGLKVRFSTLVLAFAWSWGFLLCNMLLCDLRDVRGDRKTGVVSIPVQLGKQKTQLLLWALVACNGGLAVLLTVLPGHVSRLFWITCAILGSAYLASMVVATRRRRSESFYEWWVEGILFVPAVIHLLIRG